jgi:hypothetical protein
MPDLNSRVFSRDICINTTSRFWMLVAPNLFHAITRILHKTFANGFREEKLSGAF